MYPIMLHLQGKRCLVVGAGGVAFRKTQGLVDEGARVHVVAPDVVPQIALLAERGQITLEKRSYREGEAADYTLVFTATNVRDVNRRVFEDADAAGVWVNSADDPENCTFHLPARVRRPPLQIAIASAGQAPFAVRRLRQLLERRFGPEWGEWIEAATRYRKRLLDLDLDSAEREVRFHRFFESTVDAERLTARVPTAAEQDAWIGPGAAAGSAPPSPPREAPGGAPTPAPGRVSPSGPTVPPVALVGAGPGSAGLLTLRGRERLMEADVVVYDRLAAGALPCDLPAQTELHCVGKTSGNHPVPQEEITALLVRLAREGKRTVRLKGGDPYVFGRGGEEAETLRAEGIPFEVVPGVTSGFAATAWAGIPVTHRGEAVRVTLLTAHESIKRKGPQVRWDLLAQDRHNTIIGYMGVSTLSKVRDRLLGGGMDPKTPAAMVERGTTAAQRSVISTLKGLPEAVERAGIGPPALFVIGPTVARSDALNWFDELPLAGERLVVPAGAAEWTRRLETAGAEIVPVRHAVTPAARVVISAAPLTGCVLRSPAEVEMLDEERQASGWEKDPVAWCVGLETAERARRLGWARVRTVDENVGAAELIDAIRRGEHDA